MHIASWRVPLLLSGDSQDVAAHLTFFRLTLGGSINSLPSTSTIGSSLKFSADVVLLDPLGCCATSISHENSLDRLRRGSHRWKLGNGKTPGRRRFATASRRAWLSVVV